MSCQQFEQEQGIDGSSEHTTQRTMRNLSTAALRSTIWLLESLKAKDSKTFHFSIVRRRRGSIQQSGEACAHGLDRKSKLNLHFPRGNCQKASPENIKESAELEIG